MSRKIRNIVGLTFTFISRSPLYGSSICRPSLLDRRAKTKCNRLFTDILYETYAIGVFRCQEADLVPFSCFISLLVAKYNNFVRTVKVRQQKQSHAACNMINSQQYFPMINNQQYFIILHKHH